MADSNTSAGSNRYGAKLLLASIKRVSVKLLISTASGNERTLNSTHVLCEVCGYA